MKGAFLVSSDGQLYETVRRVLLARGGKISADGEHAQLRAEPGILFTAYRVSPELEWEFKGGKLSAAAGTPLPDVSDMTGVAIECRSELVFAALAKAISDASAAGDVWVVDGDGVVWPASEVDPARVRL
jgi:hypothetical protein